MTRVAFLALAALVPAIVGSAPAAASRTLLVPLCAGDGQERKVQVPLDEPVLPGSDPTSCCVKGCHTSSNRKRADDLAARIRFEDDE